MIYLTIFAIIIVLIIIVFILYRNEKCHHQWIKQQSTYSEKEYTFHYICKKM